MSSVNTKNGFKESGLALYRSHEHNDITKEDSLVRDMVFKTREYKKTISGS